MPAQKRFKTKYPGIYYIMGKNRNAPGGSEKIFYMMYRKDGRQIHEKAGRQFQDDMTAARASSIRALRITGREKSNAERRRAARAKKEKKDNRWTIDRLWAAYRAANPDLKGWPTYRSTYNLYIKDHFGDQEPADILYLDIKRVENRIIKDKSPQTAKHVLALLRRLINFGTNSGLCAGLGFRMPMPKVHNEKTEDLTPEQVRKLLAVIDDDPHPIAGPIMKLALFTGMRRGEIFKLKWKDLDFEHNFIYLREPKGGPGQKIPMSGPARSLLESLPRMGPYVFPGRSGGPLKDLRRPIGRIRKKAELPEGFRPLHGLRHVYASMLASSGRVDMFTLQKLLTHKDFKMTQRYAHLRDDALQRAARIAGELVDQVENKK